MIGKYEFMPPYKNYQAILLFIFLCICTGLSGLPHSVSAQVQNAYFERLTMENGLSQNSILCMIQDSKGFIWIGTQDGLNKYDGYTFKIYRHDTRDPASLSNNYITSVIEDRSGVLWVGTLGGGINQFDRKTETFISYKHDPSNPNSLTDNIIRAIMEDSHGLLWIGTDKGLDVWDREKNLFTHYRNDPSNPYSISHNLILSLYEDPSGKIWIGTNGGGMNCFNRQQRSFMRYLNDPKNINTIAGNVVEPILHDSKGFLWVGVNGSGLDRINMKTGQIKHFKSNPADPNSLSHNNVNTLYFDRKGNLWIGTLGGGLCRYDSEKDRFSTYRNNINQLYSLASDFVQCIIEDRSGILWIGTSSGGGISKFDPNRSKFQLYRKEANGQRTLSSNMIWSVYEEPESDGSTIWIGTDRGINLINRVTGNVILYDVVPDKPTAQSISVIRAMLMDSKGNFWVGTRNDGLYRYNKQTGQYKHYEPDNTNPRALCHNMVRSIIESSEKEIWVCTDGGINKYNPDTDDFIAFRNDPSNPNSLSSNNINFIKESQDGIFWVGTFGRGLNRWDRKQNRLKHYLYQPNNPNCISNNNVLCMVETEPGLYWIGTSEGLNRFDSGKEEFKIYTVKDGLPNNFIYHILKDDHNNLWMSTNNGITKFTPSSETFRSYDVNDGLQGNEFNMGAAFKSRRGEMFFGGVNGLNAFYPDSVKDNPHIPPIVITDYKKFDVSVKLPESINEIDQIELSYRDNFFGFEFAALDFTAPGKNQYMYKLEGFDEQWINCGNRRYASYTNLDGGDYVFRVMGSNNDGVWNEEGASIRLTIVPPFWKTWPFRIIIGLLIVAVAFMGYRVRVKSIEDQNRRLERQVTERTQQLILKTSQLEKTNLMINAINSEINFVDVLNAILKETKVIEGVDRAGVLVLDSDQQSYAFKASIGIDYDEIRNIRITPEEAEKRYMTNSIEIYEDIYIVKSVHGRPAEEKFSHVAPSMSMLVTRIRVNDVIEGYLILDNIHNENAFDEQDLQLLRNLKAHIKSAFIKGRMLDDLQKKNQQITEQLLTLEKLNNEIQLANEKIREADKLKSDFLARMSHELRTPLNAIIGFSELVLGGMTGALNEEQKACLNDILESGRHLLQLINDILDISKIEAGKMELQFENFNLRKIFETVEHTLDPLFERKNQRFDIEIEDDAAEAYGDSGKIKQVIINLVSNANKFTPDGGRITLSARKSKDYEGLIEVSVSDTGRGIREEDLTILFDEYRQFGAPSTRGEKGTGLGLALCKRFVEMHGGTIWAESEYGKGSVFSFTLQCASAHLPAEVVTRTVVKEIPVKKEEPLPDTENIILVIEDDEKARRLLKYYLEREHYAVIFASDGEDAIELAKKYKPKVITLDILLPHRDGWEILRDLRLDKETESIPVIIVSMLDNKDLGYSLDADDYFVKPVDKDKLLARIKELSNLQHGAPNTILIIDDDPKSVKLTAKILEDAGENVLKAFSGREGLDLIGKHKPDLIILDLMMPEMSGFEVVDILRRDDNTKDIPVFVLTAKEITKEDREALDGHIKRLMTKGNFDKQILIYEIKKCLMKRKEE